MTEVRHLGAVALESGAVLPDVQVAYEQWGPPDAPAVLVCHALTGDSHVAGEGGWWGGLVGPGAALDTDRFRVVCPNVLGGCRGTTGPASAHPDGRRWGSRFPAVSVRDQVAVETALAEALGIERWAAVVGGSMGGMRALEHACTHPERVGALVALACPAAASAEQVAWCHSQLTAIRADPAWEGGDYTGAGPVAGLGIARMIAHTTYRSERELAARFGREVQPDGRFAVESYLDHHAAKLVARFDAGSYVVLTQAMNGHDVGRGRGGAEAALSVARGIPSVVAAVDTDRLYPPSQQQEVADALGVPLSVITSPYGHDGFLLESKQVGALVAELLAGSGD